MADIENLIRGRCLDLSLTQAELAEHVGVTRAWIIDAEKGKARLENDLVLHTFTALGLVLDARPDSVSIFQDISSDSSSPK